MNLHGTGPAQGFWALLTDDERAVLTGLGRTAVYPPGTVMCVEGDPATHVFVLVKGWVKIVGVTSDGHGLTLPLRGRGDTVGEMADETTGHRTATVQAIGTVRALVVPYDKFSSFLDAHDGAGRAYRRMVTRRWNDADGSSRLGALFRVTLPLAMPGVVTALIFTFIAAWNEFIAALTLTTSNADYPLTVRLDSFIGQYTVDWQHLFGASVVATIPVFLLFALIEGRVVGGLTAGSVK